MELFRLPLYWLFINTTGPILCGAVLFTFRDYFRGWRAPLLVLLPLVTDSACSIVVGLPIYSALHAPGANEVVRWAGAFATCAFGVVLLDALARWLLHVAGNAKPAVQTASPMLTNVAVERV